MPYFGLLFPHSLSQFQDGLGGILSFFFLIFICFLLATMYLYCPMITVSEAWCVALVFLKGCVYFASHMTWPTYTYCLILYRVCCLSGIFV